MDKKNIDRKNIYIIIFIVTTVIAACLAIIFFIKNSNDTENLNGKIDELNSNIQAKEDEIKNLNDQINEIKNTQNDNNDETSSENNNTSENTENEVIYRYQRPTLDVNKCLNKEENVTYSFSRNASFEGVTCKITSPKEVAIDVDWSAIENFYGTNFSGQNPNAVTIDSKKINFSKNIIDVYIYSMGQGLGQESILFLMEDGSVEYIPLYKALEQNNFRSYGALEGVEGIVEILNGTTSVNGNSSFAIKQDGSFYNLSPILRNTGNY